MSVYYNEIDPFAAQWLRHLIVVGHIAAGDVDERDIKDVKPEDIKGYTQCHFFAGIGAWSYALRLAGWPDDKPVWTGSCPCQPFSCAGKGKAFDDERHLWPEWYRLIRECRPAIIFGEQVDAAVRWGWLDLVQSDLEAAGYACGAAVIPAAGVGAPHIRHRLWFVGKNTLVNAQDNRRVQRSVGDETEEKCPSCSGREEKGSGRNDQPNDGESGKLADSADIGQHRRRTSEASDGRDETREQPAGSHTTCKLGNAILPRLEGHTGDGCPNGRQDTHRPAAAAGHAPCGLAYSTGKQEYEEQPEPAADEGEWPADLPCGCSAFVGMADTERDGHDRPETDKAVTGSDRQDSILSVGSDFVAEGQPAGRPTNGFWADADWLFCRDGKWRPVVATHVKVVDGASAGLVRMRSEELAEEEMKNGTVQTLRKDACAKAVSGRRSGISFNAGEEKVLQQKMYGGTHEERCVFQLEPQQDEGCGDSQEKGLRDVRGNGRFARASCGRQSEEQQNIKFEDIVPYLPSSLSLAKLYGDRRTAAILQVLCDAIYENRTLLGTPNEIEEIWASLGQEEKDRIKMGFDAFRWKRVVAFPTEVNPAARMGRLRAYGNAIVPQVAAAFIRACM